MRSKSWLVRWAQWLLGPPFSRGAFCGVAHGMRGSRSASRRWRLYLPSCCPVEVDLERCQTPVRHQGQRCRVVRPSLVAGTSSENQRSRGPGTRVFSDSGTALVLAVRHCAATKWIRWLAERMGAKHGRFYVNPPFGRLSSASVPIRGGRHTGVRRRLQAGLRGMRPAQDCALHKRPLSPSAAPGFGGA